MALHPSTLSSSPRRATLRFVEGQDDLSIEEQSIALMLASGVDLDALLALQLLTPSRVDELARSLMRRFNSVEAERRRASKRANTGKTHKRPQKTRSGAVVGRIRPE